MTLWGEEINRFKNCLKLSILLYYLWVNVRFEKWINFNYYFTNKYYLNTDKHFSTGIFQASFENFDDSRQLTCLKKTIKRHYCSKIHKQEIHKPESRAKTRPDLVDEKAAAMRCANICYNIYKNARPYE